jgi:type III secretion system YscQ/HrcQ family protein
MLPRLSGRQMRLRQRLERGRTAPGLGAALEWLEGLLGGAGVAVDRAEVLWRASGLARPGVTALLAWPRLGTRLALGIETPLTHALVDRLLGFERLDAEGRLQVTPVEWGILTFVVAGWLARLERDPGPLGPWDLVLDRVGPDPFDPGDLGGLVTLRWPVRIEAVEGSVRLWLPEPLVAQWLAAELPPGAEPDPDLVRRLGDLAGDWRALAGTVALPRGLGSLRLGSVLPPSGLRLRGSPLSPTGALELVLAGRDGRCWFPAEPAPLGGGGRLIVTAPLRRDPRPREALAVIPSTDRAQEPAAASAGGVAPGDVPITLTVELGRVSLSLRRLTDLKPGDVIELGRHSREPVELTSGGRLVARGELVQIDTELGVRVTSLFL